MGLFLFFKRNYNWGGDNIKRLNNTEKQAYKGGSFYAVALGIGILVATATSLITSIISACRPNNTNAVYGERRSGAMIRLSPVPSRSSISIF